MKRVYSVAINSDRVHIVLDSVPVETFLFSYFSNEKHDDGADIAIGVAVVKALKVNDNKPIQVRDLTDKWSLKCSYYKKVFATREELIEDVQSGSMDPNYLITLNGKSTGEKAIDLIQF